jgi:hypothetical protein
MQFDESPSIDEFKDGMPENMPDPNRRRRRFFLAVLVLALVVAMMGAGVIFKQSGVVEHVTGTGVVRGRVVDVDGKPFQGRIFILGTELATQTDENGNFELGGVPDGEQVLIVADDSVGRDFDIQVATGAQLELGEIQFISTATAP